MFKVVFESLGPCFALRLRRAQSEATVQLWRTAPAK